MPLQAFLLDRNGQLSRNPKKKKKGLYVPLFEVVACDADTLFASYKLFSLLVAGQQID